MRCILCKGSTRAFWTDKKREFVQCTNCGGVQLLPYYYISKKEEEARYLTHNNDVKDPRYQDFVKPITSRILERFTDKHRGLDYGCGTGPVAASELEKEGFFVALYDPYFHPDPKILERSYDFIICCEVMEHFYRPEKEFKKLARMLNAGGKLYCKTSLYSRDINFEQWYYKNDPTHVFFYTTKSLEWIKKNLGFSAIEIHQKVIIFSN